MSFKSKKLILAVLFGLIPFGARPNFMDTCSTVGKTAATISLAANLAGYETVEPIATVSGIYNMYSFARLLGCCVGFAPQSEGKPSTMGTISGALSNVSLASDLCHLGYILLPDSVKWAACSAIPEGVALHYNKTIKFIHDHKIIKAAALATYVAYKVSQQGLK